RVLQLVVYSTRVKKEPVVNRIHHLDPEAQLIKAHNAALQAPKVDGARGRADPEENAVPESARSSPAHSTRLVAPPSTAIVVPVTYEARSEQRNATTAASSSGSATRPSGADRPRASITWAGVTPAARARASATSSRRSVRV